MTPSDPPAEQHQQRRFERRATPGRRMDDKEALQKGFDALTERLSDFIRKALIAFAVLGVSSAIGILGFGLVLRSVQNQRYNVFVTNCQDSNDHNKNVNAEVDRRIGKLPTAQQALAQKQSEGFRVIIDAAFPFRKDCKAYARARMKGERG